MINSKIIVISSILKKNWCLIKTVSVNKFWYACSAKDFLCEYLFVTGISALNLVDITKSVYKSYSKLFRRADTVGLTTTEADLMDGTAFEVVPLVVFTKVPMYKHLTLSYFMGIVDPISTFCWPVLLAHAAPYSRPYPPTTCILLYCLYAL